MTASTAPNGDTWVVSHTAIGDTFLVWRVSASGVATTPIISRAGMPFDTAFIIGGGTSGSISGFDDATECLLKMSASGSKLLLTSFRKAKVQLFDFDQVTGRVSGPIFQDDLCPLGSPCGASLFAGGAFSPDGTRLYIAPSDWPLPLHAASRIYQYDLTLPVNQIAASRQMVFDGGFDNYAVRVMQLGVDGKLYFATDTMYALPTSIQASQLNVIDYPNRLGAACGVRMGAVVFPYPARAYYPPALNETFFRNAGVLQAAAQPSATPCQGDSVTLLAFGGGVTQMTWAPGRHLPAGATGPTIRVPVDSAATYRVQGLNGDAPPRLMVAQVTVQPRPRPAPPVVSWSGGVLTAQTGGVAVGWQWLLNGAPVAGATSATYQPTQSGAYSVVLTGPGTCTATSAEVAVIITGLAGAALPAPRLQVWPVPTEIATGLQVQGTAPGAGLTLRDALGRVVRTGACDRHGQAHLPTSGLSAGSYWLEAAAPGAATQRAWILLR